MKKWAVVAGGIIIAGIGIVNFDTKEPSQPEQIIRQQRASEPINPLAINGLRQRQYSSSLVLEQRIKEAARFVTWRGSFDSDGLKEFALVNIPKGQMPNEGWPVVIVNHGYIPPTQYSTKNSYVNTAAYFANNGFLVLKPDYRGHDESEGETESLQARINYGVDVLNMIAGIKDLPEANESLIFMYGHSMGGDVSLRVAEVCGRCIKAVTLWAPAVTSWPESTLYFSRKNNPQRLAKLEEQLGKDFKPEDYGQVGVSENLNFVEVPVVVHHGTADQSVPHQWGVELVSKLKYSYKAVTFYSYPGDSHDIPKNWGIALGRDVEFFRSQF